MFITLFIDAMWVISPQFYTCSFLACANLQFLWHRDGASSRYCWNTKLSSPRQLLVLQYYYKSFGDPWKIKTMVNAYFLHSRRYYWHQYARSRCSGIHALKFALPTNPRPNFCTQTSRDHPHHLPLWYDVWTGHHQLWELPGVGYHDLVHLSSYLRSPANICLPHCASGVLL